MYMYLVYAFRSLTLVQISINVLIRYSDVQECTVQYGLKLIDSGYDTLENWIQPEKLTNTYVSLCVFMKIPRKNEMLDPLPNNAH